ncbi:MAG: hypothetical protein ONB05_04290 [candidate division KSB1 bacterium]|nr:hypothetical protein [candidate division KSB1 bacterium]
MIILILWGIPSQGSAQTTAFSSNLRGYQLGGTLGLGAYQTYGSLYFNLQRYARLQVLSAEEEVRLYQRLLSQLPRPRYVLFQVTVYPLAGLSSSLETDYPEVFDKFRLFGTTNLLRSLGSGPEEPYALSLFLGNIAIFARPGPSESSKQRQTGSAVAGFIISAGHWHILDNIRIVDRWFEAELKLKGSLNEPKQRRLTWDFRLGVKLHQNNLVHDVAVLSILRDQSDWDYKGWSLWRNSVFHYTGYVPIGPGKDGRPFMVRHLLSIGKKYPLRLAGRSVLLRLSLGILWEWVRLFDREIRQFQPAASTHQVWLIQPSVEF